MGVMTDYFAAADDNEAAATIDDGPHQLVRVREVAAQAPRRGLRALLRRRDDAVTTIEEGFDVLESKGILPDVQLAVLEELLTGRPYDQVTKDPAWAHAVAILDEGERIVGTVTHTLSDALAEATPEQLREVAVPWAESEEFYGSGDPDVLGDFLIGLGELARRAKDRGDRLYCWTCV